MYIVQRSLTLYAFLLLILLCPSLASAAKTNPPSAFTYAGYEVPEWPDKDTQQPANGNYTVSWKYPVFIGNEQLRLRKLNGWLRTVSLRTLFQNDEEQVSRMIAMKDSAILVELGRNAALRNAAGTQSELVPKRIVGPYLLFTQYSEWMDGTRPQHGIDTLVYDYQSGTPTPLRSLFKGDAEEKLAALVEDAIRERFREDKRAYITCQKQTKNKPKLSCERQLNDDDVAACVNWRTFNWHLLTIENAQRLSLTFPYDPGWRQTCGDEYYVLEGKTIEGLFAAPALFRPNRTLAEIKQ